MFYIFYLRIVFGKKKIAEFISGECGKLGTLIAASHQAQEGVYADFGVLVSVLEKAVSAVQVHHSTTRKSSQRLNGIYANLLSVLLIGSATLQHADITEEANVSNRLQ